MKNLKKKAMVLVTAATMAVTSLAGCGSINNSDVVATVGDSKITAGVVNYYARWNQASMEAYYGGDLWGYEVAAGTTYEDTVKEGIVDTLKQMYILEDHMSEYNVTLTADEEAKIAETAKKIVDANDAETNKVISANEEVVSELLRLFTISNKMREAMVADVSTEVSDDEAAQKAMLYVSFPFSTTDESGNSKELTDDEKAALKIEAEQFAAGAKDAEDFEKYAEDAEYKATKLTFDSETTSPAEELITAADALNEGECTDVIATESGYYVAKVTSLFDEEATATEKENIVAGRKNDRFEEIYKEWEEAAEYDLNQKVLNKIDFVKVGVTFPSDDTTDTTTEE